MRVSFELNEYNIFGELWSGGRDTLTDLTVGEIRTVLDLLEGSAVEWDLTAVNDFFWFEREAIAEWLGFDNYDQLMRREV